MLAAMQLVIQVAGQSEEACYMLGPKRRPMHRRLCFCGYLWRLAVAVVFDGLLLYMAPQAVWIPAVCIHVNKDPAYLEIFLV